MRTEIDLIDKEPDVIKAEYYQLMARIMDVWIKIPPESKPNAQQDLELRILEELAMEYIKVMKERNIYFINWLAKDE